MEINSLTLANKLGVSDGHPIKVIYHNSSIDGFSAAFLIWLYKYQTRSDTQIEFYGTEYGMVPNDLEGRHVICLGFTYRKPSLMMVLQQALSVTVIDNHVFDDFDPKLSPNYASNFRHLCDDTQASCTMVWNLLYAEDKIPDILVHIQDRELWRFKVKNTREVLAALSSYSMEFSVWYELFHTPIESVLRDGQVIRRYQTEIGRAVNRNVSRINFLEYTNVPIVNCPWFMVAEVVGALAQTEPFALGYFDSSTKRHFSLRSSAKSPVDVCKLARKFGGGGHKNAAGFTLSLIDHSLIFGDMHNITHAMA
jgi:hypothetical protein